MTNDEEIEGMLGLGSVDEVSDPKSGRGDEYEADVAVGGLIVSSGQSAAVLEL